MGHSGSTGSHYVAATRVAAELWILRAKARVGDIVNESHFDGDKSIGSGSNHIEAVSCVQCITVGKGDWICN